MPKIEINFDLQPGEPIKFEVKTELENPSIANHAFATAVTQELAEKFASSVMLPAAKAALAIEQTINSLSKGESHAKH